MAKKKNRQDKNLPDIGGVHSLFSSANEAKGRQENVRGLRKGTKAATEDLTKGLKKGLLPDYKSAEQTVAATGPAGVERLGTAGEKEAGLIQSGLDTSLGAVNTGYDTATGAVNTGAQQGRGDITTARDTSLGYYQPYAEVGQKGSQSYADALGLNGPEGVKRAQGQFQTGPGYDFALNQGLQAIQRTAAANGALGGGGTTIDQLKYSQGLANQEWSKYLTNLQGEQQLGYNTAGAQSGISTGAGTALANIDSETASRLSNLATGRGTDVANLQTGAAKTQADIDREIASKQVAAETDAATKAAAIRQSMGEAKSSYWGGRANLDYSKYIGIGGARNQYQAGKDQTGANVFGAATSAANTAASVFAPRPPAGGGYQSTYRV